MWPQVLESIWKKYFPTFGTFLKISFGLESFGIRCQRLLSWKSLNFSCSTSSWLWG